eukprot:5877391-Pleurochrysis_carterae.AAC.2
MHHDPQAVTSKSLPPMCSGTPAHESRVRSSSSSTSMPEPSDEKETERRLSACRVGRTRSAPLLLGAEASTSSSAKYTGKDTMK